MPLRQSRRIPQRNVLNTSPIKKKPIFRADPFLLGMNSGSSNLSHGTERTKGEALEFKAMGVG